MLVSKTFVVFFFLCFVHVCFGKPATSNEETESRGIMTSIWGWITYPFSWWNSGEIEQPVTGQLLGSTTYNPTDIVNVRNHNVTIWCDDQTCNTMKCDNTQCRNITCNIYDTKLNGECREYNITTVSNELKVPKTTEMSTKVLNPSKTTESLSIISLASITQDKENSPAVDKHPINLKEGNITCNIYDTYLCGESREHNITTVSDELKVPKTTEMTTKVIDPTKTTETLNISSLANTSTSQKTAVNKQPIDLKPILSSTVKNQNLEKISDNTEDPTIHKTKV